MQSLQLYEIKHVDFSSRFKPIRKQKDSHLGEYTLMKDKEANKRVIVKPQPFESEQELELILEGIASHLILNECPSIVKFLGYSVKGKIIHLIYQNHESTLEESLKGINNKALSDKSLNTFLLNMIEALAFLESLHLNHLDIKPSNILEQNKETLNNCFKLFYTHYTSDSIAQIRALNTPFQSYYLSSLQLDAYNNQELELTFDDKIHSDIQSLGLISLWLGTPSIKDKFYQYNEEDELEINQECIARRMKEFRKNYSKKTIKLLEILLGGQEDTFNDIVNAISSESQAKSKKQTTITEENEERERTSREQSLEKFERMNPKSFDQSKHYSSKNQDSSFIEPSARRKYYLQNLNLIEQRIIYRAGTKELLPNMEEKQYADGSYYIGELSSTKQREGKGIYYYSEGDVYAGDWRDNTLQGYGIYLFSNGEKYQGGVERGVKVGKGEYVYCNNNKYEGEWENDKKHGQGVYLYQNKGEKYEGEFRNGMKQGTGVFHYANSDRYEGEFHRGDKHGNGVAKYHHGGKVTGIWQNGELNGNAFVEYSNSDESSAEFVKGVKEGQGSYTYHNSTQFQGQYENNSKTGNCTIKFSNGDSYKGYLLKSKREGEGVYNYSNGSSYIGEWKNNSRHGRGQFRCSNGTTVSGQWTNSALTNPCTILYPNGDTYQGNVTNLITKEGQGTYFFKSGEKLQGQFKNNNFLKGIYLNQKGTKTVI